MTVLERMVGTLPPPFAVDDEAVVPRVLDHFALEVDAINEDLDRLRRTHWVDSAYRFGDLVKLADLVGVAPLPGETLPSFRVRLHAIVAARLRGAVGPDEMRRFVYDYLRGAEDALDSVFVPGLREFDAEAAFEPQEGHPNYRPLALIENPLRERRSAALEGVRNRIPYLYRWQESNRGLAEATARLAVTGLSGGRTAMPLLINLTAGEAIGYDGVLAAGQRLELAPADDDPSSRAARALLDGHDVTGRVYSVSGFELGAPFDPPDRDPEPRLPRMARGPNDWIYLSVGLFDSPGLDNVFYAIADADLGQGSWNATFFDHALFAIGSAAAVEQEWTEVEPASFEVHVPRCVVAPGPAAAGSDGGAILELLADALRDAVDEIHAAGVRAQVLFEPFRERQEARVGATLPWVSTPPAVGPSGEGEVLELGGRYGDSGLDGSRFE